ncbi:MAG: hypothetical protein QXP80_03535 [Zestosphaera sp.]
MYVEKTQFITGLSVLAVGVFIVLFGAFLAYDAYNNYRPLLPAGVDLQSSITNTVYELLNLVIKLGFLGAMIWAGSVLLSRGVDLFKVIFAKEKRVGKEGKESVEEGEK